MRITNNMMTNGMLLSLSKSSRVTNTYYTQLATTKRFQQPSEDPISASRALRFRTNISNTEQYQKNVSSASAWMNVTDASFSNMTEILTERITYLVNQGANDTLVLSDRQKITAEIEDLLGQIAENEMNANYAGRYVFSGYKTNEPPVLTTDNDESYTIDQEFKYGDLWNKMSFQKSIADGVSTIQSSSIINLAYSHLDSAPNITLYDKATGTTYSTPTITTVSINENDPDYNANVYEVGAGEIRYVKETGELVMGENILNDFMSYDMKVQYSKTGFESGELNPKVYFNCKDNTTGVDYKLTNDEMMYGVSIGTNIKVNSLAKDVYTDNMYSVLKQFVSQINSMSVSTEASLKAKYEKEGYTGDALDEKINEQLQVELNNVKTAGHNIFNSMITVLDGFVSTLSTEYTNLGTRMSRVDVIDARLGDDETNYTQLLSNNEDTDYMEAIMKLNSAETAYQAAMQVGAKLMQMSLINYI